MEAIVADENDARDVYLIVQRKSEVDFLPETSHLRASARM